VVRSDRKARMLRLHVNVMIIGSGEGHDGEHHFKYSHYSNASHKSGQLW